MLDESLKIDIIKGEDLEQVLDFLHETFYKDEPICKSLKLISESNPRCTELEDFRKKGHDNGISLKAVIGNKIVGVCLNNILHKGFLEELKPKEHKDEKRKKIWDFLCLVDKKADVFSHYPQINKAIEARVLSVNNSFRGRGIGKALLNRTREIGKENGCGFMVVDCTSNFTAKAVQRLGFNCIFSLNYSDYKVDGKPVFEPEPPHVAVNTYVQAL